MRLVYCKSAANLGYEGLLTAALAFGGMSTFGWPLDGDFQI